MSGFDFESINNLSIFNNKLSYHNKYTITDIKEVVKLIKLGSVYNAFLATATHELWRTILDNWQVTPDKIRYLSSPEDIRGQLDPTKLNVILIYLPPFSGKITTKFLEALTYISGLPNNIIAIYYIDEEDFSEQRKVR